MQELRLVAVSEDGSYLVLATVGRGTRFTLPVDERLRAVVRGHFSRLGQYEIEVESPLRPKEIQARIRAGETAEDIAESAGIPVERVRWFEGPVLQEREYMAQQAQRLTVRRQGDSSPGPPLGEAVSERLARRGVDREEIEWDSWKCDDSTWRVRLSFLIDGRPSVAEWLFDPRRRHISALDEEAARLSSLELDHSLADTVTPLMSRRASMKVVSEQPAEVPPAPQDEAVERHDEVVAETAVPEPHLERATPRHRPAPSAKPEPRPQSRPERGRTPRAPEAPRKEPVEVAEETVAQKPAAAAASGGGAPTRPPAPQAPAAQAPAEQPARRKSSARGRRASVPSWDEIMFGARRPE